RTTPVPQKPAQRRSRQLVDSRDLHVPPFLTVTLSHHAGREHPSVEGSSARAYDAGVLHVHQLRPRRPGTRGAQSPRFAELALTAATILAVSVVAAESIAGMASRQPKPLLV